MAQHNTKTEDESADCARVRPTLNDRWTLIDNWLFSSRQITIEGDITFGVACDVIHWMNFYNRLSTQHPIILRVMSPGGSTDAGAAIVDQMLMSQSPIWTINAGIAYSMAAEICAFGKLGRRFAYPSASFMMHPSTFSLPGGVESPALPGLSNFISREEKASMRRLARHIKMPFSTLFKEVRNTKWMTFQGAKKMHLVDAVWTATREQELEVFHVSSDKTESE